MGKGALFVYSRIGTGSAACLSGKGLQLSEPGLGIVSLPDCPAHDDGVGAGGGN